MNSGRGFEVSSKIIEWDIRRAGLNLIKQHKLLPEEKIEELENMDKKDADIKIGKMQIRDKDLSRKLEQAFTDIMNLFLDENQIDRDLDIISIKKDACFVINKHITTDEFPPYIKFIPKNEYHAFIYIKPYEFYFKKGDSIDIKNLSSDKSVRENILNLHKDGILNFILYVVELAERTRMNLVEISKFLHNFIALYKRKELDFDYYREFSIESKFRYQLMGSEIMADHIDERMLEKINIEYNYKNIILPLVKLLI